MERDEPPDWAAGYFRSLARAGGARQISPETLRRRDGAEEQRAAFRGAARGRRGQQARGAPSSWAGGGLGALPFRGGSGLVPRRPRPDSRRLCGGGGCGPLSSASPSRDGSVGHFGDGGLPRRAFGEGAGAGGRAAGTLRGPRCQTRAARWRRHLAEEQPGGGLAGLRRRHRGPRARGRQSSGEALSAGGGLSSTFCA